MRRLVLIPRKRRYAYVGGHRPVRLQNAGVQTTLGAPGSLKELGLGRPDPEPQVSSHNRPDSKSGAPLDKAQAPDPLAEFDEYGTELHKDARVWKVYVNEADKHDTELVNGWNESTDVILIFAALFSAISTAFLIESSKLLQPDPGEESARSLLAISQTLSAIANGTQSPGSVPLPSNNQAEFTPSRAAVCVNVLWYLSLGLSLAISFIAILAKDWCSSFMRGRTGHPYSQMSRRQQKWDMIVKWKMSELLTILPSLIHLALLLFSVGLCIYLSHMHVVVVIPIFCATGAAIVFYIWSSVAAISIDHFPYPTIISRVCPTDVARHAARATFVFASRFVSHPAIRNLYQMALIAIFAAVWILGRFLYVPCMPLYLFDTLKDRLDNCDAYLARSPPLLQLVAIPLSKSIRYLVWYPAHVGLGLIRKLFKYLDSAEGSLGVWLSDASWGLEWEWNLKAAYQAGGDERKEGDVTSLALSWLITNCENPQSVDIALQSIAGATSQTPRQPLLDCHATLEILRRLAASNLYKGSDARTDMIVSLYSRALAWLGGLTGSASGTEQDRGGSELEGMIWDVHQESEKRVAALIVSGNFDPTPANLEALRIGNTAASNTLKLLGRDSRQSNVDISRILDSIVDRLESHVNRSEPLHEAALLSLANATALLLPFRSGSFTEKSLGSLCMRTIGREFIGLGPDNLPLVNLAITCADTLSQSSDPKLPSGQISRPLLRDFVGRIVECYTQETAIRKLSPVFGPEIRGTNTESAQLTGSESDVQDTLLNLAATGVHALHRSYLALYSGEAEAETWQDEMLRMFRATQSPLSLVLVASSSTFIPFLILVPIQHISLWTSPPVNNQWTKIASESRFPTLSHTLARLVEQSDLISHLETIIEHRDISERFVALGQLWLLFTAYLNPSNDLADERGRLGNQLQRYTPSPAESEHGQHARIGDQLVDMWGFRFLDTRSLGTWPFRLMECVYQSRDSPVPEDIRSKLRADDVPKHLRGLSSFTSWRPQPNQASTSDVPQPTNDTHATANHEDAKQDDQTVPGAGRGGTGDEVDDTGAAARASLDDGREAVCEEPGLESLAYGMADSGKITKSENGLIAAEGQRLGDMGSTTGCLTVEPGDVGNSADGKPHISIDIHASGAA